MQLATIPTIPLVITISASAAALVIFVFYCLPTVFVRVERGTNDTESAKSNFLRVLKSTEKELVIYDDGDASECSLYQDQEIVDEVLRFLKERPVKVRCLFTYDENLLFTQTLTENNVDFAVRITNKPRDESHFKVADSGRMMYLTEHQKGACERTFRLLDCTLMPSIFRWHVKRMAKDYLDPFRRVFESGSEPTGLHTTNA